MSKVEKKVEEVKGELTYEDKVIQKIIGLSLENIPACWLLMEAFSQT